MWDVARPPGTEPRPPALGAWSLSHWTTREVPVVTVFKKKKQNWRLDRWILIPWESQLFFGCLEGFVAKSSTLILREKAFWSITNTNDEVGPGGLVIPGSRRG